jgi:hypothetical protein
VRLSSNLKTTTITNSPRSQALLYLHLLLLSWLTPGGGRGIVGLDLINCQSVQSTPSLGHPAAREDVGSVAARAQAGELFFLLSNLCFCFSHIRVLMIFFW